MGGRPTKYNKTLALAICSETAISSKSLKTICEELDIHVKTVLTWLYDTDSPNHKDFSAMYARAKEQQADFLAEEILAIADDGTNDFMTITKGDNTYNVEDKEWTSRSKLRVDSRKWIASKLKPKKYADKLDVTSQGDKLPAATPPIIFLSADKLTDEQLNQYLKANEAKEEEA
jgi:hypothetical protein